MKPMFFDSEIQTEEKDKHINSFFRLSLYYAGFEILAYIYLHRTDHYVSVYVHISSCLLFLLSKNM